MPFPLIAALAASALGAGASIYGAKKQSDANKDAQAENARLQRETNDAAWTNWLLRMGVAPLPGAGAFTAGTMPTAANSQAVNTRLPFWMTTPQQPRRLVRKAPR